MKSTRIHAFALMVTALVLLIAGVLLQHEPMAALGGVGAAAAAVPAFGLGEQLHGLLLRHMADAGLLLGMTTLAADTPRTQEVGDHNDIPVIASDIIYEGAAVGLVAGTGHARPLVGGDRFAGFAQYKADNSAGAAAAINVRVLKRGAVQLAVSGAVITDVGQPIYATDDDTFVFSPVGGSFIGFVKRFVSTGVVIVEFDVANQRDPWAAYTVREAVSANKTLDAEDTGKLFWVDTDAVTITLPAIATGLDGCTVVNGGAFGAVAVTLSPDVNDMILGPDITGANDKDLINTKATARRGDYVTLGGNDADGYAVLALRGTWARQA